uniref:SLATT domain-containing protein n=1 Tax=uncultured Halomonas sp. TaxID=173971 RepID=UPI00261A9F17|nr:SLATT domain-containing protein [uncultured Halomonas sp.]
MDWEKVGLLFLGKDEYKEKDLKGVEKLNRSLIMAAKCRFLASTRLKHVGMFASHTTTVLSLGLIFIPLMQVAGLELSLPGRLINVLQIFLAVSVLVYSVINSQARYSLRSEKLNQCGDQIKEVQRQLEFEMSTGNNPSYEEFHRKYSEIDIDAENHSRLDYQFARLDLKSIYNLTGFRRVIVLLIAYSRKLLTFAAPITMFLVVFVIILDVLKIWTPLSDILVPLMPTG